ncbi:MAG: hypothetical protein JWQ02_2731, partial [Capsulimonas sp.]|nr:hypothetical protein [Capsulimonas sp.]
MRGTNNTLVPDRWTRERVKNISSQDVQYLEFDELSFLNFGQPTRITDKAFILQVLTALSMAVGREEAYTNRVHRMEVVFKPLAGKRREPLLFHFCAPSPLDSFGPQFQQCLVGLGRFEAILVRSKARDVADQAVNVEICVERIDNSVFVDDPEFAKALVQEIARLPRDTFAPDWERRRGCGIDVCLTDGS